MDYLHDLGGLLKTPDSEEPSSSSEPVNVTQTDSEREGDAPPPAVGVSSRTQGDPYRIGGEIGRGGVGIVLRAVDTRLDRQVALKHLQRHDPQSRRRFDVEMRITARLEHPGVVPIHDIGLLPSGEPFYAMKLIEGRSLKELIAERRTLTERLGLLPNLIAMAETIAYAHSKRIIHRDLKPSNVVVGAYGETMVIDWGLAKDLTARDGDNPSEGPYRTGLESGATVTGQVIGTPAYMPPEQARGEEVDERADVYALGAVLRHVLTGVPPYSGSSSHDVLRKVLGQEPVPIDSKLGVPPDLLAIMERAMHRDSSRRYASATELVVDLRNFTTGRLVSAYSYGVAERFGRWLARRRGIVVTAALALVVLLISAGLSVARISTERDDAIRSREAAEAARRGTVVQQSALIREQAARELDRGDSIRALKILREHPPDEESIGVITALVRRAVHLGVPDIVLDLGSGKRVAESFSADGKHFGVARADLLRVWDTSSGQMVVSQRLKSNASGVCNDLESFTTGSTESWFVGSDDGLLTKIDLRGGAPPIVREFMPCGGAAIANVAVFDDASVVAGCGDGRVVMLDLPSDSSREIARHQGDVWNIEVLRTTSLAVSAGADGVVTFSHLRGQSSLRAPIEVGAEVRSMSVRDECGLIAIGAADGTAILASVREMAEWRIPATPNSGRVGAAKISHDCRFAAFLDNRRNLTVVDITRREIIRTELAQSVAFSERSPGVFIGQADGTIQYVDLVTKWSRTWKLGTENIRRLTVAASGAVVAMAPSSAMIIDPGLAKVIQLPSAPYTMATVDNWTVAVGCADGSVAEVNPSTAEVRLGPPIHHGAVVVRSSGGSVVTLGRGDGCVYSWPSIATPSLLFCFVGLQDIAVSHDGFQVVGVTDDDEVVTYDADLEGAPTVIDIPGAGFMRVALDDRTGDIFVGLENGAVVAIEAGLPIRELLPATETAVSGLAVINREEVFVCREESGWCGATDRKSGQVHDLSQCADSIYRIWDGEGQDSFVGVPCASGEVEIFQGVTRTDIGAFLAHLQPTLDVAGSTDGRYFASVSVNGWTYVFDTAQRRLQMVGSNVMAHNVELVTGSGFIVAATSEINAVLVWPLMLDGSIVPQDREVFRWLQRATARYE